MCDCATWGNSSGIGKENYLQQDAWIIGRRACLIIVESFIKDWQIQFVINKITERVLKGTLLDLFIEEDGDKLTLSIGESLYFATVPPLLSWLSGQFAGFTQQYTINCQFFRYYLPFSTGSTSFSPDGVERSGTPVRCRKWLCVLWKSKYNYFKT